MASRALLLTIFFAGCSAQVHTCALKHSAYTPYKVERRFEPVPHAPRDASTIADDSSSIGGIADLSTLLESLRRVSGGDPDGYGEMGTELGKSWRVPVRRAIDSNDTSGGEPRRILLTSNDQLTNAVGPMLARFGLPTPNAASVSLPIRTADVTGLNAALSQINNSIATLSTTVANLSASLNAQTATIQSLVPVPTFVDFERPSGSINGSNSVFALNAAPSPASSLVLIYNGIKLSPGNDFSLSGNTIVFAAGIIPQLGDTLIASYRR